jgi:predicted nucleic-acid-binding protein
VRIIDANIILRYLTNDVQDQAERAGELLTKVEAGSEEVFLPDIILADIIWVLEGYYKQSREQIREWITTILSMQGLRFSDKNVALDALDIYVDLGIDWSDAFVTGQMINHGIMEIYSFDRHFDRIGAIKKIEP